MAEAGAASNVMQGDARAQLRRSPKMAVVAQFVALVKDGLDLDVSTESIESELTGSTPATNVAYMLAKLASVLNNEQTPDIANWESAVSKAFGQRAASDNPFSKDGSLLGWTDLALQDKINVLYKLCLWNAQNIDHLKMHLQNGSDLPLVVDPVGSDSSSSKYFVLRDQRVWVHRSFSPKSGNTPSGDAPVTATQDDAAVVGQKRAREEDGSDPESDAKRQRGDSKQVDVLKLDVEQNDDGDWQAIAVSRPELEALVQKLAASSDASEVQLASKLGEATARAAEVPSQAVTSAVPDVEGHTGPNSAAADSAASNEPATTQPEVSAPAPIEPSAAIPEASESGPADSASVPASEAPAPSSAPAPAALEAPPVAAPQSVPAPSQAAETASSQPTASAPTQAPAQAPAPAAATAPAQGAYSHDQYDGAELGRGSRAARHQIHSTLDEAALLDPERQMLAAQQTSSTEDPWYFDCEICGMAGWNLDDGSETMCCDKCEEWQHIDCHRQNDAARGRPPVDYTSDAFDFVCLRCQMNPKRKKRTVPSILPAPKPPKYAGAAALAAALPPKKPRPPPKARSGSGSGAKPARPTPPKVTKPKQAPTASASNGGAQAAAGGATPQMSYDELKTLIQSNPALIAQLPANYQQHFAQLLNINLADYVS
ncbi:hypothetical protein OIV83_000666 [Microbotryomycetes sp. JL201]|nr:hypothetical protein OIV83_000666 [Microbotryomycetes sp. JL201]